MRGLVLLADMRVEEVVDHVSDLQRLDRRQHAAIATAVEQVAVQRQIEAGDVQASYFRYRASAFRRPQPLNVAAHRLQREGLHTRCGVDQSLRFEKAAHFVRLVEGTGGQRPNDPVRATAFLHQPLNIEPGQHLPRHGTTDAEVVADAGFRDLESAERNAVKHPLLDLLENHLPPRGKRRRLAALHQREIEVKQMQVFATLLNGLLRLIADNISMLVVGNQEAVLHQFIERAFDGWRTERQAFGDGGRVEASALRDPSLPDVLFQNRPDELVIALASHGNPLVPEDLV